MARRPFPRPTDFDPNRPVIVRRKIKSAGRDFLPGDAFDWRRLAVDQNRVRQLFDAGKLRHERASDNVLDAKPSSPEKTDVEPEAAAPSTEDAPEPETGSPAEEGASPSEDELDAIDNMNELREIAEREGAPFKVSKQQQRDAIREHRAAGA